MATVSLNQTLSMAVDGASEPWDITPYSDISFQVNWSGADAITSNIEVQVSNDGVLWSQLGRIDQAVSTFTMDAASGSVALLMESKAPAVRLARLAFTANTNTTGSMTIFTWGRPHRGYA